MSDDVKTADADVANNTALDQTVEQTPEKPAISDDALKALRDELLAKAEESKSFYLDKLEIAKKQIAGLDKKNSDLQRKNKEYERKEMTEAEKYELERKELMEERAKLDKELAIAKYQFVVEDGDNIDFGDYLQGESREDVFEKAERLKIYLDKKIAAGIEKGVESRLAQGYKPAASGVNGEKKTNYDEMTKEELTEEIKSIKKMPEGEEKSKKLKKLLEANSRKFK